MKKNYLDTVPKDDAWLLMRELQWSGQEKRKGLSPTEVQGLKHRLFHYEDDPQSEIEAYKNYFFNGDIETFIKESERIRFQDIIFYSPVQIFESMQFVISVAVTWLLEHPSNVKGSVAEYLSNTFNHILSPPDGLYLPDNITLKMFSYFFGSRYEKTREIQLTQDGTPFILNFTVDVEYLCLDLLSGIRHYVWGTKRKGNNTRYKYLIDYFLSIYPHLNPICFSRSVPVRSSFGIEDKITRGHYTHTRWLIASLHGIVTEFDLDDGYEPLESLIINDHEALEHLKTGMAKIQMPDEYYELEKFVLKHGEDCIYTSE